MPSPPLTMLPGVKTTPSRRIGIPRIRQFWQIGICYEQQREQHAADPNKISRQGHLPLHEPHLSTSQSPGADAASHATSAMMPASDQVERSTSTIRAFRALARYSSCASACGTAGRSSDTNPVYPMHARPTCFSHLDNHIARLKRSARHGESRRRQDKSKNTNNPFDHRFLLSERYSTLLETGDTCRSQAGLIWINPSCGLESRGAGNAKWC
jgi:hypothetical protein